jgi:hypothetical protein
MQIFAVTLGAKTYEVQVLNVRKSRDWRRQFEGPLTEVMAAVSDAGNVLSGLDFTQGSDLTRLFGVLGGALLGKLGRGVMGSMDAVADMLFAYSPELAAQRDAIEQEATDEEVLAAFVGVLKAAYPFGGLLKAIRPGPASK